MLKTFCDKCGKELNEGELGRVKRKLGRFAVEVIVRVDKVWNAGALCPACVIEVARKGKPIDDEV